MKDTKSQRRVDTLHSIKSVPGLWQLVVDGQPVEEPGTYANRITRLGSIEFLRQHRGKYGGLVQVSEDIGDVLKAARQPARMVR